MDFMTTLLITAIAATLSANLAVGRFKKERAWEKKEEAFSMIIKGIRASISYDEAFIDYSNSFPDEESEKHLADLLRNRKEAKTEAKKILHSHYLFMSREEISTVEALFEELYFPEYMDSEEMASQDLKKNQDLLAEAEKSAKESLHITQSNTYVIFSRIWKWIDNSLEPVARKL